MSYTFSNLSFLFVLFLNISGSAWSTSAECCSWLGNVSVSGNRLACVGAHTSLSGKCSGTLQISGVTRVPLPVIVQGRRKVDGSWRLQTKARVAKGCRREGGRCAVMLMSQSVLMLVLNSSKIGSVIWIQINRQISRPLWGPNGKNKLLHLNCFSRVSSQALIGPVVPTTAGKQTVALSLWPQGWLSELLWIPQL